MLSQCCFVTINYNINKSNERKNANVPVRLSRIWNFNVIIHLFVSILWHDLLGIETNIDSLYYLLYISHWWGLKSVVETFANTYLLSYHIWTRLIWSPTHQRPRRLTLVFFRSFDLFLEPSIFTIFDNFLI